MACGRGNQRTACAGERRAGSIVLFTILKIVVDWNGVYLFAWIGLLLALVIGYGGWMRWQEHQAVTDGLKGGDGDTV